MKGFFSKPLIRQFLSYICVGGAAAIVEWAMFTLFANVLNFHYILATALAFIFSTFVNWLLGRIWTFRESRTYEHKRVKEILLVFAVSAVGLLFNMLLMYLLVTVIGLNTPLLKTVSKIISTGIVFFWNFLIRRFVIYRQKQYLPEDGQ